MANDFASDELFAVFDDNNNDNKGSNVFTDDPTQALTQAKSQSSKRKRKSSDRNRNDKVPSPTVEDENDEKRQKQTVSHLSFEKMQVLMSDIQEELSKIPRIKTFKIDTTEACLHEVATSLEDDYTLATSDGKPAKEYKFALDPFQKEALKCLECNESVLVSAHTSAGKTVVAEYAIAMSLRDKQRVIYTTPIKALSNQKYRDFSDEFQDVGLMTGDVTINPSASCLVMTTEILRNMLYRGSEIMREVAWVIFDEIHYMRDKERGVVWEETIILLPDNVHYVFLSATIPNAKQFAEWICYLHKQPCHVVYTDYRPVPLQHYIFPADGDGLYLIFDDKGEFRDDNFKKAIAVTADAKDDGRRHKGAGKGQSDCFKIIKMAMERDFQPVIAFSFSKKDCEAYALQVAKLDFNTAQQKKLVEEVFNNAIDSLSDEDKKLPQIAHVLPLLKRGIGIHHSGLLPILKETIEILFSEGLIKALFATETFAMGLNMPARTVVFTSIRKFDGKSFRPISSGEYIQMSGRAGRRGLDDRGTVIVMIDKQTDPNIGDTLYKGEADPLTSAFHLSYNMVLNLLRVEEINPEYMLEKSFYQFQHYSDLPKKYERYQELEKQCNEFVISREDEIASYFKVRQSLNKLSSELKDIITKPKYCLPFLQPGRLVKVKNGDENFGWGCVINFERKDTFKATLEADGKHVYVIEVLLNCAKPTGRTGTNGPLPCNENEKGEMQIIPITMRLVESISAIRVYLPKSLIPLDNRQSVFKSIQEVCRRFPDGLPLLDPIEDMKIKDTRLNNVVRKIEVLEKKLYTHRLHDSDQLEPLYNQYYKKVKMIDEIKAARQELKRAKNILQMDELKCRKRVLRRLGYATSADVIEMKGRVACEISSSDELVLTEMIFSGFFNDLSVEQLVAILSCFVSQEKGNSNIEADELREPLRQLQETARRIAKVSKEAKMDVSEEDYVESFRWQMMDITYDWCKGASFFSVCQKREGVFEGSIIRCMRRLEELLRQMCQASKVIGNTELENKFAEGITKIKRDIVFAASLYV
ncbi:Superkiller viralicidic activity 2-like 2 [Trichoplax sp. H2]|nr:Superkiller viralicidic activity 2-like 2 [Trichoplax sp. H2]|eukprot:RDD40215.1 Superkiller viralicidic activity 2-like 2 [Trichoplax sp. H2]